MKSVISVLSILILVGCGSIKVRDVNTVEVEKIKKVAIVAFSVVQPDGNGSFDDSAPLALGASIGNSAGINESNHALEMYKGFLSRLQTSKKWKTLSQKELLKNKAYNESYKSTMLGWQNKSPIGQGRIQYIAPGIMDAEGVRILGTEKRNKLISDLGVDAIVAARVDVNIKANTVMGIGPRKPYATISFRVFTKNMDEPVWFDGQVIGDTSEQSLGVTGFYSVEELNDLAVKSAQTAFNKIQ